MFDPQTDFEQVADGLETVTLVVPQAASNTITGVLRREVSTTEQVPSGGKAAQHDCVWHLPVSQVLERPPLGARLRDSQGNEWTLLAVSERTLSGRWQCRTRNLALAYDLNQRIYVERPEYAPDQHGSNVASWQVVGQSIPARVQPVSTQAELAEGVSQDRSLCLILVTSWDFGTAQVRMRDTQGRLFELLRIDRAERLGELVQLQARRIA